MDECVDYKSMMESLLWSTDEIPAQVIEKAAQSDSFEVLHLVSEITHGCWKRIHPVPDMNIVFNATFRYYLMCVDRDVVIPGIHTRYEAARDLYGLIRHLTNYDLQFDRVIRDLVVAVEQLYLSGNEDVKDAIVDGFLEHALESDAVMLYFEHWKDNPELLIAHNLAMDWVRAIKEKK